VLGLRLLEGEDAGLELHLAGVRWADIDRVVTEVLHLEPGSWKVASLAQVEWYVALSPPSAQRLAKALGGVPQRGNGSLGRKEFLLHAIPVDIPRPQPDGRGRPRAPLHGEMNIYRILNGATAVWKAELMLCGLCGCSTGEGWNLPAQPDQTIDKKSLGGGFFETDYTLKRKWAARKVWRAEVAEEARSGAAPRVRCPAAVPHGNRGFPRGRVVAV
jgi:hypothetical protein